MEYTLHCGDNREVLRTMADASVDSIVCDPPYELGFMGKHWDSTGIAYDVTLWTECLRVLKPGGHLIAFGGSRTYHRLAVAIEDAGFDIRDQIQWIYGSGFPKSHNLKNDWHGWGTALKPAHEPAVLARKPLTGTVADNVTAWGVGALNIDGCRVDSSDAQYTDGKGNDTPKQSGSIYGFASYEQLHTRAHPHTSGRWPANVLFDEEAAQVLDDQSGERKSGTLAPHHKIRASKNIAMSGDNQERNPRQSFGGDIGGASRFFYVAKASKAEREAGLDAPDGQRANHHPTVKPIELMRYFVRLVTPKCGTVLDPFMGSGSTGCAAMLEGMNFVGIDITPEYVEIARRRILHHANQNPMGL
jgi:DNA modification methylase